MANVRVEVSQAAVRAFLHSRPVVDWLDREAEAVEARANAMERFESPMEAQPYGHVVYTDPEPCAVARVATRRIGRDGNAAIYANAAHNTLVKAMGV